MSVNIINSLSEYGLNRQQTDIYLHLVKSLESNVTQIERATSIPRATIYKALDRLQKDNLVSKFRKRKVLHFTPTNINQLQDNLERKLDIVSSAIPILKGMVNTASLEPTIRILSGKDGIRNMWEQMHETFQSERISKIYALGGRGANKLHPKYFKEWKLKTIQMGVTTYITLPEETRGYGTLDKKIVRKFYPNTFSFEGTLDIYGNNIAIASFDKETPHATIIKSNELAELFKQVWSLVWSMSSD
jgi:sugar-specific transcriptional regulator TrmB